MTKAKRQQLTLKVHQLFQLLLQHPGGLETKEMWNRLETTNGNGNGNSHHAKLSFEEFSFFCVSAIKAGWLVVERNRWTVSERGQQAYERFSDPQQFMIEVARQSTQGWLAARFPQAYSLAARTKDQMTSEVQSIRRIGVSRLLKETFGQTLSWQDALPVQSPRTVISGEAIVSPESLVDYLRSVGVSFAEGGHAVYLRPEALLRTAFKETMKDYPADAGLKIMKNSGGVDDGGYLLGATKGDSRIHLGMVHNHRHLTLVANLLHAKALGPRLYDLVNLKYGDQFRTAYVVRDVGDRVPTMVECEKGIQQLRELDKENVLRVMIPEGFSDEEFECPTCCNNALMDDRGQFNYIDFQNFLLGDYEKFLTSLAKDAADQTHFGDTSVLRGGRYLYQSVPGVKLPGKRDVANRMKTLSRLFAEAGVSVADRLVLDVGCNIGMMMSEYLRLGAKWCHGWDRALTTPHTERLLLALGCTRFSTTGSDITKSQALTADLPSHAAASLAGCAISYLAVRGHIGWLDALQQVPWSFMIYEGHEGETAQDFESDLAEFRKLTSFDLGPTSTYIDGDSEERTIAVLLKR